MSLGRTLCLSILVLFCFLVAAPAFADQLLNNPGFETGNFSGWTLNGNSPNYGVATAGTPITGTYPSLGSMTVVVNSGSYAGYAVVCKSSSLCEPSGDLNGDYLDLSQAISVVPGDTYTVGMWIAASAGLYGGSSTISVDGSSIFSGSGSGDITSTYKFFSGTFTASDPNPTIDFHIQGSGAYDAGFSFDDFSVTGTPGTPAPEPGTLALLGTGLIGLVGAVRRKRA
jgi:hypothetical protein